MKRVLLKHPAPMKDIAQERMCNPVHARTWEVLQCMIAGLLGMEVARDQPLMEAGLDSIGAVELRNAVSTKFGIELPATVTFDQPTVQDLAHFLVARIAPPSGQFAVGAVTHTIQTGPDSRALADSIAQVCSPCPCFTPLLHAL